MGVRDLFRDASLIRNCPYEEPRLTGFYRLRCYLIETSYAFHWAAGYLLYTSKKSFMIPRIYFYLDPTLNHHNQMKILKAFFILSATFLATSSIVHAQSGKEAGDRPIMHEAM